MAEKKVSKVTYNGVVLMDISEDSVTPETLAKNETAHDASGEQIIGTAEFGGDTTDCYKTTDTASTDIDDADYIPFNDVSDAQVPKKKTLFSTIINKLKSVFLTKQVGNSNNELFYASYYLGFKDNDIDATKADNNVSAITFPSTFRIVDKNSNVLGVAECVVKPNGNIGLKFYAKNYDTEGVNVAQKGMEFRIAKDGVMEYVINDPYKFQAAIGSGYCEGTVSGTAITATIPGFVLVKGGIIVLKMSAAMPIGATLNINNTGAKDVYWENSTAIRAYDMPRLGNMTWILTYDGARYLIVGVSKSTIIGAQNYVADTSGNIVLNAFYDSNAFQFKYNIGGDALSWNRFKNNAWYGDVQLVDKDFFLKYTQFLSELPTNRRIAENDDLNDYTEPGIYQCTNSSIASSLSNCPVKSSFKLIVDRSWGGSNSEIMQRITIVNSPSHLDWYRSRQYSLTTWGEWKHVASVAESAQLHKNTAIVISSGDLNDYKTSGTYYFIQGNYPNITNAPPANDSYMIWVMNTNGDTSYYRQIAFARANQAVIYSRIYNNGNWSPWYPIYSEVNLGINISSNANLNDYKTPGVYNIGSNATAATISNMPIAKAGKLIVMAVTANQYKVQQYIPFNIANTNNDGLMYQRSWINDNSANIWSDWIKYADYRDLNQSVAHTGKNLLTQKHLAFGYLDNGATHVTNGITFTFNTDGSIKANGTATADAYLMLCTHEYGYMLPKGSYVLTGCPSGGSASTYRIGLELYTSSNVYKGFADYGSGVSFTLTEDCTSGSNGNYFIRITSGATVSNIVFKPMLRHAYTDATYEKYIPNGQDVKGVVYVGTCTTAADQQVKVVNVDSDFRLKKGVRIAVKFSNSNTYNSTTSAPCQLNVNSTGAKNIYYNTASSRGGNTGTFTRIYGVANRYIYYFFNGTDWVWDGCGVDDNSTNFLRNDASSTMTCATPFIALKASNIDEKEADNGVSNTVYPAVIIQDKNAYNIARLETYASPNGDTMTYLMNGNYNTTTSATFHGGIRIYSNKSGKLWYVITNAKYFNGALGEGYGTCATAADQQVKNVACDYFTLCVGAVIHVRFTNTNTYNSTTSAPVKLNVNSTGEKVIYYSNNPGTSSNTGTNTRIYGEAGRTFTYMYDGTYWVWLGCGYEADSVEPRSFGFGYGTCDTTASTAAKVATLSSYVLRIGGYVSVYFLYDVPANATLNINSKGAKTMRYKGANLTAGKIRGGDIATFVYDGTYYVLVGIDSSVPDINTMIAMSDCDWSATLKSKCTMATSGGTWNARMINNNFLYVSVETSYSNAVAATIPSYGTTTTEVFFRIKNKFKECLNISEVMVDLNGVIYPAFAAINTVDNVSCVTVSLRKPASLVAGSGNIRFTFILPCKRI